ncbi:MULTISPECIES: hypothetical protein [Listeria]|uniref:hypothetical protein n=1 Tax=Listeria TaxID=1637 RepID=UPI001FC9E210|nr:MULTISPECIES: hypothetical protein [Listeria]
MTKNLRNVMSILLLVSVTIITGCGEQATSNKPVKDEEQRQTMKKENVTENNSEEQSAEKVEQIKQMLKEGLRDGADVSYQDKQFTVMMTNDKLKESLNKIKENPADKKWKKLIKAFELLSKQIETNLAKGYTIRLADPEDINKTMLTILDGKVTYDFSKE